MSEQELSLAWVGWTGGNNWNPSMTKLGPLVRKTLTIANNIRTKIRIRIRNRIRVRISRRIMIRIMHRIWIMFRIKIQTQTKTETKLKLSSGVKYRRTFYCCFSILSMKRFPKDLFLIKNQCLAMT